MWTELQTLDPRNLCGMENISPWSNGFSSYYVSTLVPQVVGGWSHSALPNLPVFEKFSTLGLVNMRISILFERIAMCELAELYLITAYGVNVEVSPLT